MTSFKNIYKTPAESSNPAFGSTWAPASTHNMTNKHGIHAKRENPIKTNEKPTFYTLQAAPPGACQTPSGPLWDLLWTLHPPSRQTGGLSRPTGALTWPSGALLGPPLRHVAFTLAHKMLIKTLQTQQTQLTAQHGRQQAPTT